MKRAILIDGNNLLFRSYYATAYTGNVMKNSKGFPTNALFGFVNMINKILNEEKPEYVMVAFDKGKNFRHELYLDYKAGRSETPKELLEQFPIAKEILDYMGIIHLEIDNYEADDIIGTFAKMADFDKLYDATIISSDKDLLQLISSDVDVKLLKQTGYIMMNQTTFFEEYKIKPIRIIDLKALQGDPSDNIPGVKGVGEKTALALLQQYETLEDIYENIDNIKGKLKEKLENDKENAFFSKKLATIYKDIPFDIKFEDLRKKEIDQEKLYALYEELEFFSLIKNKAQINEEKINIKKINSIDEIEYTKEYAYYLEVDNENYHFSNIIGMSIYNGKDCYYISKEVLLNNKNILEFGNKFTYDAKKSIVALKNNGIEVNNITFDTMLAAYLLNLNIKDDIAYLSNTTYYKIEFYENIMNKKNPMEEEEIIKNICFKSKFIYETKEKFSNDLKEQELLDLFLNIELPLTKVLSNMEYVGINVNIEELNKINEEISVKEESLKQNIYNYAGCEFNISSTKQLGEILFEKLGLPFKGKKRGRNGYSTSHEKLIKLTSLHPIIEKILEYRNLNKIKNTYLDTLGSFIKEDNKIHPIFKQTITRTGRLSCTYPNLQNIPVRNDEGKKIRKAFTASKDSILLTSDYSQIELRILAHYSGDQELINSFIEEKDIHTKVASDIFNIPEESVTKNQRRTAKAVIFGIVYGISEFGLGENLNLKYEEAKKYIDKYLSLYPDVKNYMDNTIIEAKENNIVRTIMNRKRIIGELSNKNYMIRSQGERMALNTPIQGSSADIIKKAMIDIYSSFEENNIKSKIILQVHDELVIDCLEEEFKEVKKIVKEKMENAYKLKVPLKVEIDTGKNWYETK